MLGDVLPRSEDITLHAACSMCK